MQFQKVTLRGEWLGFSFRRTSFKSCVRFHLPGSEVVLQIGIQTFLDYSLFESNVFDGKTGLYPPI